MVDVFFRGRGYWCVDIDKKIFEREIDTELIGTNFVHDLSDVYLACGVFRLDEEDEIAYRNTKSLENLDIKFLLPSKHPDCEFSRIANKGRITPSTLIPFNIDDVYFRLATDQPEPVTLTIAEPYQPTNIEVAEETEEKIIPTLPAYLNPQHPMFSEELNIAIEAWTKVLESNPEKPSRGSRKKLIEDWLETSHPTLSREAKERIAKLLNPDKNGGAPRSD